MTELAFANWRPGTDYQVIDLAEGGALLFVTGNHRLLRVGPELAGRLRRGLSALTDEERAEWNRLAHDHVISEIHRERLASADFSDGANLAINVNLTAVCNLGCTYCFADGGDYGRITGKMEAHTVDHIFDFIREHLTPTRVVRFEFFGGEPLLNFERIAEICRRSDEMREATGVRFLYRISTNLTKLPAGALELFAERGFVVSVSIDGGQETHDRNRPTKGGQGSFRKIIGNCIKVRQASDDIVLVARMTVVGEKPTLVENVRELWDYDIFDYFQIYPGVVPAEKNEIFVPLGKKADSEAAPSTGLHTMAPGFLRQFDELVDVYPDLFQPGNRFRGVLEYERLVDMLLAGKMVLSFCSGGRNYFTFSPDDSIMPCHRLVGETDFQAGTGGRPLAADLGEWRVPVDDMPVCSSCWVRYACGGGCKQENFVATGSLNEPNREGCNYQIKLVENIARMVARQDQDYRHLNRLPLDDMFVSCGRPVIAAMRSPEEAVPADLVHFSTL